MRKNGSPLKGHMQMTLRKENCFSLMLLSAALPCMLLTGCVRSPLSGTISGSQVEPVWSGESTSSEKSGISEDSSESETSVIFEDSDLSESPELSTRSPISGSSELSISSSLSGSSELSASSFVSEPVPVTTTRPALTPEEVEDPERPYDFSLGFAGDINFADDYIPMGYLAAVGSDDIAAGIDQEYIDIMNGMDLMWINNEFTYSDRGEPLPGKAFTFRSSPSHVSYLKDLGIDIVGLANNHSYDYGEISLLDTMDVLDKAGIPYVGAGRNIEEAASPVYLETNGFTIAYVAASCAEKYIYTPEATASDPGILLCVDNTRFLESIRTAAEHADFVIALPHWGNEHTTWLTDEQKEGARAYIDAGADAVIGAHPHVLQGIEFYKDKPILYSLGNFWFDNYDIDTIVAELHFSGTATSENRSLDGADIELIVHPGTQTGSHTYIAAAGSWKDRILRYLEQISVNISIDDDLTVQMHSINASE